MTKDELIPLIRCTDGGIILPCHVQPRASRTAVAGIYGNAVKIALNAPPVDGKANAALCEFLAKKCGIPKSAASVVSGDTSRDKNIFLRGVAPETAAEALCAALKKQN